MAAPEVIEPPPGFVLEAPVAAAPPPPPGFELEQAGVVPPPPSGFVIETASPTAPAAPGTPGPARDPLVALAVPALAVAPPVTPSELDALGARLGVSPETAPAAGAVAALPPLPEATPELRDASRGFLNNLSVRDLIKAPQHGAAAGVMKYLTGNTAAEQTRRRRALGQDTDPIDREFLQALEATYQAAGTESPDYQKLDAAHQAYLAGRDNTDVGWADFKAAVAQDPGGMAAEFVKAVAADPYLLATPAGWRVLAARGGAAALAAARAAGASAKWAGAAKAAGTVAGGVIGSAATGAALTAPVAAGIQLGETGSVDVGRTARETAIAAGASAATAGVFVGLGAAVRSLRKLKTRSGVDPAAVDAEIADLLQRTETEAGKAGMTPAAARAEVERFAVDIEQTPDGPIVRPRADLLEGLPGETVIGRDDNIQLMTSEQGTGKENLSQITPPEPGDDVSLSWMNPAIKSVSEIEKLAEQYGTVYLRWSNGPQFDLAKNARSRDYVSGTEHAGLSAVPIDAKMHQVDIAKRLAEYGFLRIKNPNIRPHLYLGELVGKDSDGYALIRPSKEIYSFDTEAIAALKGFPEVFDLLDSIKSDRVRLEKATDTSIRSYIAKRIEENTSKLDLYRHVVRARSPAARETPATAVETPPAAEDLATLQARLDEARRTIPTIKNGDVQAEWERLAADLEARIAEAKRPAVEAPTPLLSPAPRELPTPAPTPPPAAAPTLAARNRAGSASEYERLARATEDPVIRQELMRQADLARTASAPARRKLTPAERHREALRVDLEIDDVLTAVRKLGGIDVRRETAGAGSDFAGRFAHLPRRGFGIPAIEQSKGGGHSLDTLTEKLHDLGYLTSRSADELYSVLDRASRGEEVYSFHADPERAFAKHLPDQDVPPSSDADWTFHAPDEAVPDRDFTIDTEGGRAAPARLITEEDLIRLHDEELANDRWFEQEAAGPTEQPGRPAVAGTARVPERLAGESQGRPGDQPQPGETAGLPGIEPHNRTRQQLADRNDELAARLRGTRDVAPGEGEGDLFSGRASQVDLEDVSGIPIRDDFKLREPGPDDVHAARATQPPTGRGAVAGADGQLDLFLAPRANQAEHLAALESFGPRVRHVKTGTFPSALTRATTPEQVAHAVAPLRRQAQESLVVVVTDDAGNILRIGRAHTGGRASAPVDPGIVAGIAANTPGGRKAWFVHNHPGGFPGQSAADERLTGALHYLLEESGIKPQGMVVVAPGGRFTYFHPGPGPHPPMQGEGRLESRDTSGQVEAPIPGGVRRQTLPVTERNLTGLIRQLPRIAITEQGGMVARFKKLGDREGVLLLDTKLQPVGFLPMPARDMRRLRQGAGGPAHKLFGAIDETNASNIAARVKSASHSDEWQAAAGNLQGFAHNAGVRLLDVLDDGFNSNHRAIPNRTTFYSNPFLIGLGDVARDIGRNTGRNLTAGAAGGALGATLSENEPGSAKWWLDVGAGAGVGVLGSQFARRLNLLGKGSIVDNWRARTGDWIESLPLIGRGPEELRDLKRKQRLMQDYLDRQTAEVGKHLLDAFTPAERAMMADLIETRGIVKDFNVIHRQAQALDDYLTHAAQRMKALKMLPEDLEAGGYLHRYYAKHLGLDRLFKEAKGQSLSGSYTIARGTDDTFKRDYFSPGASKIVDEFEKNAALIVRLERASSGLLAADTSARIATLKARQRALGKIELREFLGQENGILRSYLFGPGEVARVDTGVGRVKVEQNRPIPGSIDTRAMPMVPVQDLRPTNYIWTVRGTKGKEALLHRDWTQYERQSWGEIEDAGYRYVRGMMEVSHDVSLATLYDTIARHSDWANANPPTKPGEKPWVFVPKTKVGPNSPLEKYGALAGMYVRPDVWAGVKNYGRNPLRGGPKIPGTGTGVGDLYLHALNKWKLYETVYNPVTHFNNTYSNVEMLYMGGYSPATIATGIKHLVQGEKSAVWREARDAGLFGGDWTTSLLSSEGRGNQALADLSEQLRTQPAIPDAAFTTSLVMDIKQWWIQSAHSLDKADGALKTGAAIAEAMGRPLVAGLGFTNKPIKAAARAMQRAYRFEDNMFKMAVYAAERAKGSSITDALEAGERLFFDYQDLPEAVKLVRDLPVGAPFISYTYLAVQAVARNIAQNPERVLALIAGYEALNYAVLTAQGMSPGEYWKTESAENATSPPWDRGRALWGARNTVHLPSMEGYRVALGRAHVLGNPFMTDAGGREKLPNPPPGANFWGSSIFGGNPLHALLDVSVNEDWKGKAIYKPGAPTDEKAQKIAAYLYQAWAPSNPATPGGYKQTKILEGLANDVRTARKKGEDPGVIGPVVDAANATAEALGFGQFTGLDRADNEIVTRDALLASFGVKLRPVRVEQSVEFETGRMEKEKKKAADWFKERTLLNADGRITDRQFAEDEKAFDEALDRIDQDQDKLFDSEAFLRKRTQPTQPTR